MLIIFLLYNIKNQKKEHIVGLGGDDELSPQERERRSNNAIADIIKEKRNNLITKMSQIETKQEETMTRALSGVRNKIGLRNDQQLLKVYNKICSSDGKSCITINEFNNLKNYLNMLNNMKVENNLVKVNNGVKINNNVILDYNNFNMNSIMNKLIDTEERPDNVDNYFISNTNFHDNTNRVYFDTSQNFLTNIPKYFTLQNASLFAYNIGGTNSKIGKYSVFSSTWPTFDRTLSTIGIGYTGFQLNLYDPISLSKGIIIKRDQLKESYNTMTLLVDCSNNQVSIPEIVLYSYDNNATPKYKNFGSYAVSKQFTRFSNIFIPLPPKTSYTGDLMFNTPLSSPTELDIVIITGFGFIENPYNYIRIYPNMFNLNSDKILFPTGVTPAISHTVFTFKEISNGITLQTISTVDKMKVIVLNANTEYYLTIPIINSNKNKILCIKNANTINQFNLTQNISNFNMNICDKNFNTNQIKYPLTQINNNIIRDNTGFISTSTNIELSHVSEIFGVYEKENKHYFYIPSEYINNNFILLNFRPVGATAEILIYEILTFDEFF